MKLSQQRCVPCEGGTPAMTQEEAQQHLRELPEWTLKDSTLVRTMTFRDFTDAMKFVNLVAAIAEEQGHHPDIALSYNKVTLTLSTHAVKGLSLNDFILAVKIDGITSW